VQITFARTDNAPKEWLIRVTQNDINDLELIQKKYSHIQPPLDLGFHRFDRNSLNETILDT
jgi:hypothetical protein